MNEQKITWPAIIKVNLRFVGGALAVGYGWLAWQMTSKEWWGFGLIAVLAGLGGASVLMGASYEAIQLILRQRRWKRFEASGARPRADPMANDDDLSRGGYT